MNKGFISALYVLNIISQAIFTLLTPVGILFFAAWLLVSKLSLPSWIYAVFIPIGVIFGMVVMVRFVLSASENLERLEKERNQKKNTKKGDYEK